MKLIKKIISWLNNPKWYFLLPVMLIAIVSTIGATFILTQDSLQKYIIWGYVLFGIMGVTLSYSIFGVIRIYPKAKQSILTWAEKHPRINKLFNEYGFTTLIFTTFAIIITFAFAVYNGSIAIVIQSVWFGALAAYYIVLMILRSSILIYYGKRKRAIDNGQDEIQTLTHDNKLYRACGIMLFLLPVCLSFAILQMVREGDSFEHKGITIYVYAVYAFYKIITAIYSIVKEWNSESMVILAIRNIKLADAMVSILALQTSMFKEFGGLDSNFSTVTMNAITGLIVCLLTVALGVYMIIKANIKLKLLKQPPAENADINKEQ